MATTTTSKASTPRKPKAKATAPKLEAVSNDAESSSAPFELKLPTFPGLPTFELPKYELPVQVQELVAKLPKFELPKYELPAQVQELVAKLSKFDMPTFELPAPIQELVAKLPKFDLPFAGQKANA